MGSGYEEYAHLPVTPEGWSEYDWSAVFDGEGNAKPPTWHEVGPGGAPVEPFGPDAVESVEAIWTECNVDYADSNIAALFRLRDGRYATVLAWSDSSGWGCRDTTVWRVAADRETAIAFGLDKEARARLGLALPSDGS